MLSIFSLSLRNNIHFIFVSSSHFCGYLQSAITTPLDVLKTRMMTGRAFDATTVFAAARVIAAKEGPTALFSGLVPRVAYIGPSCAIFFMVYELVHNSML